MDDSSHSFNGVVAVTLFFPLALTSCWYTTTVMYQVSFEAMCLVHLAVVS